MIARFVSAFVALLLCTSAAIAQGNYLIKPGDRLNVEVLEDSSLNRTVLVLPDGGVSFPQAGTVKVGGRTTGQVERAIASQIADNFAVPPTVYVAVVGVSEPRVVSTTVEATLRVYLVGEVNTPGLKEVHVGTTVLQALAESGGFTKFAATKRLQLRRKGPDGRPRLYKINYRAIAQGAQISMDPVLAEGDVILVPERRLFE